MIDFIWQMPHIQLAFVQYPDKKFLFDFTNISDPSSLTHSPPSPPCSPSPRETSPCPWLSALLSTGFTPALDCLHLTSSLKISLTGHYCFSSVSINRQNRKNTQMVFMVSSPQCQDWSKNERHQEWTKSSISKHNWGEQTSFIPLPSLKNYIKSTYHEHFSLKINLKP